MAYDLEEQEQIAALKTWWNEYGNMVLAAVTAAALSLAGFQGWRYYQNSQRLAAAALYEQLVQAEHVADHKKVRDIAAEITGRYGSTAYGALAALSGARASFETGDLAEARARLQWAIEKAGDENVRDLARLRLAGVLLDQKDFSGALKALEAKPVDALAGLYADMRGDILAAAGKVEEARGAYQQALDRSEAGSPYRAIVQMKLDALPGAAPASVVAK
jgi:predicted negative regulator of RcsB-dependent stress response